MKKNNRSTGHHIIHFLTYLKQRLTEFGNKNKEQSKQFLQSKQLFHAAKNGELEWKDNFNDLSLKGLKKELGAPEARLHTKQKETGDNMLHAAVRSENLPTVMCILVMGEKALCGQFLFSSNYNDENPLTLAKKLNLPKIENYLSQSNQVNHSTPHAVPAATH